MIILDTNVVSALMQTERNARLEQWINRQPRDIFWLTAVSYFELRAGIERLAAGRHRQRLEDALARVLELKIGKTKEPPAPRRPSLQRASASDVQLSFATP